MTASSFPSAEFSVEREEQAESNLGCPKSLALPKVGTAQSRKPLELQLERELHYARLCGAPHRSVDDSKSGGRGNVLLEAEAPVPAQIEVRMVEQVEELSPELQAHAFAE